MSHNQIYSQSSFLAITAIETNKYSPLLFFKFIFNIFKILVLVINRKQKEKKQTVVDWMWHGYTLVHRYCSFHLHLKMQIFS